MEISDAVEKFREFAQNKHITDSGGSERTIINLNEIRNFSADLVNYIINSPMECVPYFEDDMNEVGIKHIGFSGAIGKNSTNPREMGSRHISKLVAVEGIVTGMSLVHPKIKRSVHYCEARNAFLQKEYRDSTMITSLPPTSTAYPMKDQESNLLTTEFGLSEYSDFQTITLQEMPERSPPGHLPRSVEVILTDDLVDSIRPGDRMKIYGIFKSFCPVGAQFPSQFRTILIANNAVHCKKQEEESRVELEQLKMVALSDMKFRAIAPTLFGHDDIKKAIAMLMVGGNEVSMKNGSRIRGNINILIVGDPSTAKSQLLRYTMNFAPLAIGTTGKGSSGVGLTAAVVKDAETGERRLEAGAMVLADRGIVCIDEFDKISDIDRVAVHEVMEQQTVTIAKAGIHTTLNARCSVLAAANPTMGVYNRAMSPHDNIGLPESLMTRFDLVFVTLDESTPENDLRISEHVVKMRMNAEVCDSVVSQRLVKEFIAYARELRPVLSPEAARLLADEYTMMRAQKNNKDLLVNITPRILETLIRLSTAHAKLRLSLVVEEEDAREAMGLLRRSNVVMKKSVQHRKRPKIENEAGPRDEERVCEQQISGGSDRQANVHRGSGALTDAVKAQMWESLVSWRQEHNNVPTMDVSEFANYLGVELATAEQAAEEWADAEHIVYDEGVIFFLD